MNQATEKAIVQIMTSYTPLFDLVADRVSWDDQDLDPVYPSVTLRTLSTRMLAAHLRGRGGLRQSLVEVAARGASSGSASQVADAIGDGFEPFESGPTVVELTDGGEVKFGAIRLENVQQAQPVQQQSYRKLLTLSVSFYT